jgi:uncharacterized protein
VVIAVSLDGVRASHDLTRRYATGASSHAAALRALKVALARAPLTEAIHVVDPATVGRLAESTRFLLETGVRVISLSMNYAARWEERGMATYGRQIEEVADEFIGRFRNGEDVYIAPLDAKIIGRLKQGLKECDKCAFGVGEVAVSPSGWMYPCERLVGDDENPQWRIGHISTGTDQGKLAPILERRSKGDPTCAACGLRDRCMNFCGCSNVFSSGDCAAPGAALCLAEQANAKAADRAAKTLFWEGNATFLRKFYFEDGRHYGESAPEAGSTPELAATLALTAS